jgi:hypothetical protein
MRCCGGAQDNFSLQNAETVRQQKKNVIWFLWFVLFIWVNQTNQMNKTNQMDQINSSRRMLKKTVQQGPSNSLYLSLGERPRLPFTARDILTRPTPSAPRRALVPGKHSFIVRVLRARRAPVRPPLLADFLSILLESVHTYV